MNPNLGPTHNPETSIPETFKNHGETNRTPTSKPPISSNSTRESVSEFGSDKVPLSPPSSQPSSFSASDVSMDKRTCSGACCTDFIISKPGSWEDIKKHRFLSIWGGFDRKHWKGIDPDIPFIADMLIPLYRSKEKYEHFTCRHFDRTKKLCTVYDKRPEMCRQFGVKYPCEFKTCGWDGALRKKPKEEVLKK